MPAEAVQARIRPRAIVLAVFTVALTLLAMRVLASAGRVIGWTAMAASAAIVISPAVRAVDRFVPRGLAIAIVGVLTLGTIGLVVYGVVGDVAAQTRTLQREAPRLAAQLEHSGRFADAAKQAHLSDRVRRVVDDIPKRLRGGTPAQAARSAATRGLSFLAIAVLTTFFVIHGKRITTGLASQIANPDRRAVVERLGRAVEARAFGYARGTAVMALMAGGYAYVVARATNLPAPVPLAVWVALWDVVPLIGTMLGALPLVAIAAIIDPTKGVALVLAFVGWQVVEYALLQRPLDRTTVHVGPFLTTAAGFAGVELYGIAGGLLAIIGAAIAVVTLEEIGRAEARTEADADAELAEDAG